MDSFPGLQGLGGAGAGVPPGVAAAMPAHQMMPSSHMSGDSGEDFDSLSCDGGGGLGAGGNKSKVEMAKERNRVHARNTRARKKQYMEELKDRVESMHAKKAAVEHKKEAAARKEEEQSMRWAATLKRVLDLRCQGVVDPVVWSEVLTKDFELSLPLTPYRRCDPADVEGGRRRVLVGVEGMISDTASLTEMCVTLAERCRQQAGLGVGAGGGGGGEQSSPSRVQLKCCVGSGDLVFTSDDGGGIMCVFSMSTVDARDFGSPLEVEKNGMLRAAFGEEGKLDELEMMFDGIAVHQQLQRAMGWVPPGEAGQPRSSAMPQQQQQQQQQQQDDVSVSSSSVSAGSSSGNEEGGASENATSASTSATAAATAAPPAAASGGPMDVDQGGGHDGGGGASAT